MSHIPVGQILSSGETHVNNGLEPLSTSLHGRRYDHPFFSAMAVLILATVLAGFAPSYYFAGIFRAPLPSTIIHVHGAVFSCWILLLDSPAAHADFLDLGGARQRSSPPGRCRFHAGVSDGRRRISSGDRCAGSRGWPRPLGFLHALDC